MSDLQLSDGARVAVVGGGPAGSFFAYFLLRMARRHGLELDVDIYEPRNFTEIGPKGCNMCGGIISESLVQSLMMEGIQLPTTVVQRSIDSYVLHMDVGSVRIETPLKEKRIAAIHRGGGPRGAKEVRHESFDNHLLQKAVSEGADLVRSRVEALRMDEGRPRVFCKDREQTYDLLAAATGINAAGGKLFDDLGLRYRAPESTKTYISEFYLGRETIRTYLGSSMHVFLLNIARLEFAAFIPKGDYVTFCMLGHDVDRPLVNEFLGSAEVARCMPPGWKPPADFCHCGPKISVKNAFQPFADRIVFVGECGASRLYKDGIGSAYRTAKAAAKTAVLDGISEEAFRDHFWPTCSAIDFDNSLGRLVFFVTRLIQQRRFARRGLWRMVCHEQQSNGAARPMSTVLWDTFTGSAPYKEILLRTLKPGFLLRFGWDITWGSDPATRRSRGTAA